MEKSRSFNFILYMLSIFVASSLFFLDGFFLVSKSQLTSGLHYDIESNVLDEYRLQPPSIKYDQIILMIIDAWRTDYPNNTNMPFAYENACDHLQIKVDIPTVTMPRLKSITTGTISNFIDIVLNLGHTTKLDESLLHRLIEGKKKSVFAGDRTWVKLFPNEFLRAAVNTDSFFVNDFYEGDKNVTKVLKEELKYFDWHLMILHYLGLDHIGHVEGSHSYKIYEKLFEMDGVIKYITANMTSNRLLLVTGDHGMRNGGSHGGSEKEELYVPLMSFYDCKNKRSYTEYNQIDISATLAVLLGVKIPHTSIGCLIPEMLESFSKEEQLYLFYYNALHLIGKLKTRFNSEDIENEDYFTWYEDAKSSHKEFISSQASSFLSYEKAKQNYVRLSKKISLTLSESLVQYNIQQLAISLSLATLCSLKLLINILFESVPNSIESGQFIWKKFLLCLGFANFIICVAHFFDILNTQNLVRLIVIIYFIALNIYFALDVFKLFLALIIYPLTHNRKVRLRLHIPSVFLFLFVCHTLSLASSSFIEEEHQTWYYFTPTLLVFITLHNFYINVKKDWRNHKHMNALLCGFWNIRSTFIVMLSLIVCRRLNQTGNKWRHIVDIGDVLSRPENHFYLTLTFLTGLILLLLLLKKYNPTLDILFCFTALFAVFVYREIKPDSFLVLILFGASLLCTYLKYCLNILYSRKHFGYETKESLVELLRINLTCMFLVTSLLHRPHNVMLLPALMYTLEKFYNLCDNLHIRDKHVYSRCYALVLKTVITIFIAKMFYFFQGNSNSLATIDLNPGYIGLSSYKPFFVVLLVTLNTYCAPINAFLYLMWHMFSTHKKTRLPLRQEKEQISNIQLVESTEEDLYLVYSLFTVSTIMPISAYWCFLVGFRYHLFIYSVFSPKAFYECFHLLVFYINFILAHLFLKLFSK